MATSQIQSALLFMPDISGFTQFVNETELNHSQHIVQELLELLIETNEIDLQVQEIEGDAIFFYRIGNKPDLQKILKQVEKMFVAFHQHLQLYEHQRICTCGACKSTVRLTLKIIVHFGEVTGINVKNHKKLFGKDVIVLHRLLKNHLMKTEYVLITDPVMETANNANFPAWFTPEHSNEKYDVGIIEFSFSDLSPLYNKIPPSKYPVYNSSSKTYVSFQKEDVIDAPMETVFDAMIDLQYDARLIQGTKKMETINNDTVIRVGTKHACLITKNDSVNVTESVKMDDDKIEFVEMNAKGFAGYRYRLNRISPNKTNISIEMLVKNNIFYKIGFNLLFKAKMMRRFDQFFSNLKEFLKRRELLSISA